MFIVYLLYVSIYVIIYSDVTYVLYCTSYSYISNLNIFYGNIMKRNLNILKNQNISFLMLD